MRKLKWIKETDNELKEEQVLEREKVECDGILERKYVF